MKKTTKSRPRYTEKDIQMLYTIKQVLRLVHDGVKQKDIISMKITSASIVSSIFWGIKRAEHYHDHGVWYRIQLQMGRE